MFDYIVKNLEPFLILLIVLFCLAPFGIWKVVEIVFWMLKHIN